MEEMVAKHEIAGAVTMVVTISLPGKMDFGNRA
jgi:hypothetical protein